MNKYNEFIMESLKINDLKMAISMLVNVLNPDEYEIIRLIVFDVNSIAYAGRCLGLSNNQIRLRFHNVLRKIGRMKKALRS